MTCAVLALEEETHLDSSQHACGGHTEVQVGQHLSCGGLINVWRTLSGEVVWKRMERSLPYLTKQMTYIPRLPVSAVCAGQRVKQPDN